MNTESTKSRAKSLLDENRLEAARTLYYEVCTADPADIEVWHLLSAINGMLGRFTDSESCAREVIKLDPDTAPAYNNLGAALLAQHKLDAAQSAFDKSLQLAPGDPETLNNLGNVFIGKGEFLKASEYYSKAVRSQPDSAEAHNNLGNALLNMQQPDAALQSLQTALRIKPRYPDATFNSARALQSLGRFQEAMAAYQQVLQLQPEHADAIFGSGELLREKGDFQAAKSLYRRSLEISPRNARALAALAGVSKDCGEVEAAITLYRQAIGIDPDIPGLYSNLLFALNYTDAVSSADIAAQHRAWGRTYEQQHPPQFKFTDRGGTQRQLVIGYVSHDFRSHSVAFFLEPLLINHDREQFRIICYPTMAGHHADATTQRIIEQSDLWHDITRLTDEAAAKLIHDDGVDILVDLSGHTAWNRLGVFALRPAPVQITYLGYPNTTGLSLVDYRITDAVADPPGDSTSACTEELLRLPHVFLTYLPPSIPLEPADPPCIRNGYVTFGSFNTLPKITPRVVKTWVALLKATGNSRILLKNGSLVDASVRQHVLEQFTSQGIKPDRIELLPHTESRQAHFELYNNIDIALDTFPYNGTTTTCEALWMGVPVVSLAGNQHASRVGLSILNELGLNTLVASDPSAYVEIATALANDSQRLAGLRQSIRNTFTASMLGRHGEFTRNLEHAYKTVWGKYAHSR